MLSHFINVISIKESTHENVYVLKEMKQEENLPTNHYAFNLHYRQAVCLYDNNSMITYLNPITIEAKNF